MSDDPYAVAAARAKKLRRELVLGGTLTVRPTSDGGRSGPVYPRYSPTALLWGAPDTAPAGQPFHGCGLLFEGDPIAPGSSGEVELEPFYPSYWVDVRVGDELGLYEGSQRTATFAVRRALPEPVLRQWEEAEAAAIPDPQVVEARAATITEAVQRYVDGEPSRDIPQR